MSKDSMPMAPDLYGTEAESLLAGYPGAALLLVADQIIEEEAGIKKKSKGHSQKRHAEIARSPGQSPSTWQRKCTATKN
ncbi:MAG TPA: hypothetical protein QF509_04980 [Rhodospirillales bacterium]|nr:hypothetical protein [Rhodospirillales bacterium]